MDWVVSDFIPVGEVLILMFCFYKLLKTSTIKEWSDRPRKQLWVQLRTCSSRDSNLWPLVAVFSSERRMVSLGEGVGRSLVLLIPTCRCPHIYLEGIIYCS